LEISRLSEQIAFRSEYAHPQDAIRCRLQNAVHYGAERSRVIDSSAPGGRVEYPNQSLCFPLSLLWDEYDIDVQVRPDTLNAEHRGDDRSGREGDTKLPLRISAQLHARQFVNC